MKKYIYLIVLSIILPNYFPANGSLLNYTHVLFEWDQIQDSDLYELQISDNSDFANIISSATTPSLSYIEKEIIDWESTYFWRIRGVDNDSNTNFNWSPTYSFTTANQRSNASSTTYFENDYSKGITIFSSFLDYFSAAIDESGNEIWNTGNTNLVYYTENNVQFYGTQFGSNDSELPGVMFSLDSEILWSNTGNAYVHHDFFKLPNGNFMGLDESTGLGPIPTNLSPNIQTLLQLLGYQVDGVTNEFPWVGDKIIEWDADGNEVWTWDAFDHLSMEDYDVFGGSWTEVLNNPEFDWTHSNALLFNENESALYLSSRNLSRIIKIEYPSGEIIWQMGLNSQSGDVDCGTDLLFSFQHSIEVLDNGNILFLDNGNLSTILYNSPYPTTRAFEISITENEDGCVVETVWEYSLPQELFGSFSGNVQKLNNGNYLITTIGGGATSLEVRPTGTYSGEIVWQANYNLSVPSGAIYRANRIEGLHPIVFSITSKNYRLENSLQFYPIGSTNETIIFNVWNDGEITEEFDYSINSQTGIVEINPGQSKQITYDATENENINLVVTSKSRPDLTKTLSLTTILDDTLDNDNIPYTFSIQNPYPNPFNPIIHVNFNLLKFSHIELNILDINGRLVKSLESDYISQGAHQYSWDATDVSSGNYFVEIKSGNTTETKKITLIK